MKTIITSLESVSPYSQGRYHATPMLEREIHKDWEERTWRERCHTNDEGYVMIPPMVFKNCLSEAAKFMGIQIPGKGKSTYTKHFEAGILVIESLVLPIKKTDVAGQWNFVPADGRRGGSKRVEKCFPVIPSWKGDVTFYVLDEIITKDVFRQHVEAAGQFIGIGVFRPRNNGFFGRFKIGNILWP